MEKRLIALMITGAISASVMTSCLKQTEEETNVEREYNNYCKEYGIVEDAYIVLQQNEIDVMHKGNMSVLFTDGYNAGGPSNNYKFKFECGNTINSNGSHQTYDIEPNEDFYDIKCEDCFDLN